MTRRARQAVDLAFYAAVLAPVAWLVARAARGALGANPIEAITRFTGDWALRFLLLSLAISPARRLFGWNALIHYRRAIGLTAFGYAALHVATWVGLDLGFDWSAVGEDLRKRPYITAGATAFVLLVPLALTSTRGWIRRLGGRRWARLHRLVYVAACAAVVHYWWLVKADVRAPRWYAAILAVLLLARLPLAGIARRAAPAAPLPAPRRRQSP